MQRSVRRPRHHGTEEVQKGVVQQVKPERGTGEPAHHSFEPTPRHRKLHISEPSDEQGKEPTNNVIVSRGAGGQPAACRMPKELLPTKDLESNKYGHACDYYRSPKVARKLGPPSPRRNPHQPHRKKAENSGPGQ